MKLEGGCYCGSVRYVASGEPLLRGQCHCRECQYISGGGPNYFMIMPREGLSYTSGTPSEFTRPDLEKPVTRQFCAACGTHLLTYRTGGDRVILKVGTLDEPQRYEGPEMAIYTVDVQPFHQIPDGLPAYERRPGS